MLLRKRSGELVSEADWVVVEGVGGWRVPLGPDGDVADLAMRLKLPVVLVVGLRLGCLNHAALTAADVRRCGLPLAGWVGNEVDAGVERCADNLRALRRHPAGTVSGRVGSRASAGRLTASRGICACRLFPAAVRA